MKQKAIHIQKSIIITGAAGFIGSHLVDNLLANGTPVIGIDNFCDFYDYNIKLSNIENAFKNELFNLVRIDIRHREAVFNTFNKFKPDIVVHLAAMAGVRPSIERPELYTSVNLDGTVNLLDAAVKNNVKKFIFASSSSVYGNNEKIPFAEDDPVDYPISPYAATKKAGELLCHTYWHLHQLPVTCLRFFTVFGPRQRPDLAIAKFFRLIGDNKPIPIFGDGSSSRDYTYVDDIIAGLISAIDKCNKYRIYNLGSNNPVSLNELINVIEQITNKKVLFEQHAMQPGDVENTWADLSRSYDELAYKTTTCLRDGIEHQWEWWLKESGLLKQIN